MTRHPVSPVRTLTSIPKKGSSHAWKKKFNLILNFFSIFGTNISKNCEKTQKKILPDLEGLTSVCPGRRRCTTTSRCCEENPWLQLWFGIHTPASIYCCQKPVRRKTAVLPAAHHFARILEWCKKDSKHFQAGRYTTVYKTSRWIAVLDRQKGMV